MAHINTFDSIQLLADVVGATDFSTMTGALSCRWESGTIDASGNNYSNVKYIRCVEMIPVDSSKPVYLFTDDSNKRIYIAEYASDNSYIAQQGYFTANTTVTLNSNTAYIRFFMRKGSPYDEISPSFATGVYATQGESGKLMRAVGTIDDGADLDNYRSIGLWYARSSAVNIPSETRGVLLVLPTLLTGTSEFVVQIFVDDYCSKWTRTYAHNAWTKWSNSLQGTGLTVTPENYQSRNVLDALTLPDGVTYFNSSITSAMVANLPEYGLGQTVLKLNPLGNTANAGILLDFVRGGAIYGAMQYGGAVSWHKLYDPNAVEQSTAMSDVNVFFGYRRFGVIGDSFASGYVSSSTGNQYEKSWVEHLHIATGATIYNLSANGMSIERFLSGTFAPGRDINTLVDGSHDCPMYIIGLGLNDNAQNQIGSASDFSLTVESTANTYYGNFGNLVQRIDAYYEGKGLEKPMLLVCNIPYRATAQGQQATYNSMNAAIADIVSMIQSQRGKCYLVPLRESQSLYKDLWVFAQNTHYTAAAQKPMADYLVRHINKVMLDNPDSFTDLTSNELNTL